VYSVVSVAEANFDRMIGFEVTVIQSTPET
jgi:hypothetical protein